MMSFDPRNILVIDFGQLGDVVLSLPALHAVRGRFPAARITVAVGKPGKQVVELAGVADDVLVVDRVALRDGFVPASLWQIARIVRDVRARRFDFVIDLHSLSETNLLGYLSGAPARLYARRPTRSLDFLANFRPAPPVEDTTKHAVDRYLDVLAPLKVGAVARAPRLPVRADAQAAVEQLFRKEKLKVDAPLVGLFPGAGHPSRQWPLERFVELARRLEQNDGVRVVVFLGPEEHARLRELRAAFPRATTFLHQLNVPQLAAALARLSVFVSNDTGPMHIATAVGTPVVVLLGHPTNKAYMPLEARHRVIHGHTIEAISVDDAYAETRTALVSERTASLFAS
ncbi:MAG TPA: glycosyltransferase family 9 protein [Pyrinomonadaceae bacterium]|jgi:ADP-heptose:LPS heptosyltransferase